MTAGEMLDRHVLDFASLIALIAAFAVVFTQARAAGVARWADPSLPATWERVQRTKAERTWTTLLAALTAGWLAAGADLWWRCVLHISFSPEHAVRAAFVVTGLLAVVLFGWQLILAGTAWKAVKQAETDYASVPKATS